MILYKKIALVVGCALHLPFFVNAQTVTTAKLYAHFAIDGATTIPIIDKQSASVLDYQWLAPAIRFQYENGRYDEIELTNLKIQTYPDAETDTRFSIGLRYEYGKRFNQAEAANLSFRAGLSIRGYYGLEQLNEGNVLGLPAESSVYGLSLGLTPHLEFRALKHLVFDFGPYIELANMAARAEYVYDQAIDEEQRDSLDFYFKGLQLMGRVGIGWEF